MTYFIVANSFAAPFVSDTDYRFVNADSPEEALNLFAATYQHPAGLYAAECYPTSDSLHRNEQALARWVCNHELARQAATKDKSCYSYLAMGPGRFQVDGFLTVVDEPKAGKCVPVPGTNIVGVKA